MLHALSGHIGRRIALIALSGTLLGVAALTPSTARAYCDFMWCGAPPPGYCPNECGSFNTTDYFYDESCFEYGTDYCEHDICWFLDNGVNEGCPENTICYNSDTWQCAF
jgi:hypothetical protein